MKFKEAIAKHINANIHKLPVRKAKSLVDFFNSLLDDNTGKNDFNAAPELQFVNPNSYVILKHLNNFGPLSKKAVSDLLGLNPGSHTSFYPLKEVAETDKVQVQNVGDQSWMFLVDNDKHNEFLSLANEGRACIRRRRKRNKSGPSRKKGKKAKHSQSK